MTVKDLREAIANLPDDGEVFVQRIEDFYFENHGWPVKKMKGEEFHRVLNSIKDFIIEMEDALEGYKEQYINTHCCINYDGKNLYITSHY